MEMTVDDWPDWLPADWMIQIRKINERKVKCYIDPEGSKFYSKPQVDRHLKTTKKSTGSEQTNNADGPPVDLSVEPDAHEDPESTPQEKSARLRSRSSRKKYKESDSPLSGDGSSSKRQSSKRKNQAYEWLPEGWTVTEKSKKSGMKYKVYQDPTTGKKFFSKPQVLNFLGNTESTPAKSKQKLVMVTPLNSCPVSTLGTEKPQSPEEAATEVQNNETTESTYMSPDYEVISRIPADGLPPGWIKEIRVRPHGSTKKKDPYYLDPLSGYVFFSKLDALRYLDSGDIKKCAMRPLRRDMNQDDQHNVIGEELGSPTATEPAKEPETTPKALTNGSVPESKTDGSAATEKRKVRSITGDGHLPMPEVSKKDEAADWLPDGWVVEVNYRDNGQKFKCYKETATGKKFYTKPQVISYLGIAASPNTNSRKRKGRKRKPVHSDSDSEFDEPIRPKRSQKKITTEIDTSDYKEVVVSSPAEGLPPGWIKEIRSRICAGRERKDPFYLDPVSGYIFRSKLDALRYLETGDINLCAIKPRKKDIHGNEVAVTDSEPPVKNKTAKQIFEGSDAELTDVDKETENNNNNNTENTPGGVRKGTRERVPKQKSSPPVGRTSSRLKAHKPETDAGAGVNLEKEKGVPDEVAGVNVEKQVEENQMDYELGDDASWEDPFHFAVKTLRSEFPGVENEEATKKVE